MIEDAMLSPDSGNTQPAQANKPAQGGGKRRPAVFLDRDGTLIEQVHYLSDPEQVRVLPGIPEALRRLHEAGFACVVITNQSAVGRGMFPEERLHDIHLEMNRQLAEEGASVDGIYYCTHAPSVEDRTAIEHPDRKPAPGMLFRAAKDLNLDISASWMVGDLISDVLTGINAKCRGSILVGTGKGLTEKEAGLNFSFEKADDLLSALDLILGAGQGEETTRPSPPDQAEPHSELEGSAR